MKLEDAAWHLSVETGCDYRTALRWLERKRPVRAVTSWALEAAAKKLGLDAVELERDSASGGRAA